MGSYSSMHGMNRGHGSKTPQKTAAATAEGADVYTGSEPGQAIEHSIELALRTVLLGGRTQMFRACIAHRKKRM